MHTNIELRIYDPDNPDNYYMISPMAINQTAMWIANQDGEGMGISLDELYKHIHDWFKETH